MREDYISPELENEIASEIIHIARRLVQRGARMLEGLNIGVGQLPILKALNDHGTLTQRQIAEEIRVTPATICGTIKRMEKSGLIRREPSEEDARMLYVSLTEEGAERCGGAMTVIELPYREMLRGFSEQECRVMRDFAHRMAENLSRSQEEGCEDEDRRD